MVHNKAQRLAEAEACFYSVRLIDAYNIFRRYFDRLPFKPEKEHARYIGMFVRILLELGKNFELKFYLGELEKLYTKMRTPELTYQLGIIYSAQGQTHLAKERFEELIRNPDAGEHHIKAKMCLMYIYTKTNSVDTAACRNLLESISPPKDVLLKHLLTVWKAYVLRLEKKLEQAESLLIDLLETPDVKENWYTEFSAQIVLAYVYLDAQKIAPCKTVIFELKKKFQNHNFRTVNKRIQSLEKCIRKLKEFETISLIHGDNRGEFTLCYMDKTLFLKSETPTEKLLVQLASRKYLDKEKIVRTIYKRAYKSRKDDKLIYSHVHSLRKKLKVLGLPGHAVANEGKGYRFVPPVERVRIAA